MDFRFRYRRARPGEDEQRREKREEHDRLKRMRGLAIGVSIPISMAAGPLGGWLLGAWLDRLFGTSFLMLALILLGTAAGLKLVIDMLARLGKE